MLACCTEIFICSEIFDVGLPRLPFPPPFILLCLFNLYGVLISWLTHESALDCQKKAKLTVGALM